MIGDNLAPDVTNVELYEKYEMYREKYSSRMKNILLKIKSELKNASWFSSKPYNIEEGEFAIAVSRDPSHLIDKDPDALDFEIAIRLLESKKWDGTRGGISFHINIVSHGGDVIGGYTPFNYSDELWVPVIDEERVEARFGLVEQLDMFNLIKTLQKWTKGKQA